jgi:two-component system sensor histidine kinase MtrB
MGARRKLSQSLATKVILSTVMLSLGVISLTGSALYSRLSDGIRQVSLDSALAESRFTFFNAQYQMLLSQGDSVEERKKALADLIISTTTQSSEQSRREVIFIKVPGERKTKVSYEMSSSLIKADSVPKALRERIQKGTDLHYEYGDLLSAQVNQGNTLFVGERINIPTAGRYEMYIAFILTSQTETLDLIRNSLLFTGVALIFLIGMITWLVVRQVVRPVRDAARIATQFTQGDFSQRMRIESQDEMATLANSYNEMAQSIEQQISRLENLSRVQQRLLHVAQNSWLRRLIDLNACSKTYLKSADLMLRLQYSNPWTLMLLHSLIAALKTSRWANLIRTLEFELIQNFQSSRFKLISDALSALCETFYLTRSITARAKKL